METHLAINLRNSPGGDAPIEVMLWGGVFVVLLAVAVVLAAQAIERLRNKNNPQREDEVWR